MSIGLALALIFAPAVFWTGYSYYHDRFKPEPLVLTAFSYFLGFLSGWLCLHAYDILLPALSLPADPETFQGLNLKFLLYCIVVVGLVEEVFKFLPFLAASRASATSTRRWTASSTPRPAPSVSPPTRTSSISPG
jgi:RsiW-degrading membrane proteinase PrsW (M82 family)